jgi:hypothetical protein
MRFSELHARRFGPHRDRKFELDSKIVLIYGRNESGKSSIRSAVETLLFGFDPATREKHPLAVWSEGEGGDLHLEADYALDDGTTRRIERVLQANAKSRTAAPGADFEGPKKGNDALPSTGDLPRALYRSVYAIEIKQLAKFETSEQARIDEILLPPTRSLGLQPIRDVRDALRAEVASLWRPRKQGRQRIRDLEDGVTEASKHVRAAEAEESELREALRTQAALEARVAADRIEKEGLEQIDRDAEFLGVVFELRQRERAHGDAIDLSALGDEVELRDPEIVEREAAGLSEDLHEPLARLAREALELTESQTAVLRATAEIRAAEAAIRSHSENLRSGATGAANAERLRAEAGRELAGLLSESVDAQRLEALVRLPVAQLEAVHDRWASDCEAHASAPPPVAPRPPPWTLFVGVIAGIVAATTTLPTLPAWAPPLPPWLAPVGIGLTLLAMVLAFFLRARPKAKGDPPTRPESVDELLAKLPVAPNLLERPSGLRRVIEATARAQQLFVEAESAKSKALRLERETEAELAAWRGICERLAIDSAGDGPVLVGRLKQVFADATTAQQRVREDEAQREHAQAVVDAKKPILEQRRSYLASLRETLRSNVPDSSDLHAGFAALVERRDEQDYLQRRSAELARKPRWLTFRDDPRANAEIEPDDAPWNERVTNERRARLAALDESIETAVKQLVELGELLGNDPGSRSARARDVVAEIREALADAKVEHDRLALLDAILVRAEQRFREVHQPDVLRRASEYLGRVTCGRYSRLDYLEGADGGLFVSCRERSEPVKVEAPISRGTLDQIFLCLRLGLLDHLDADRERLPLILDDALVRMDDVRRQEVYALLRDAAATRQVFFLTCHRAIADEAEKALATARIELSDQ